MKAARLGEGQALAAVLRGQIDTIERLVGEADASPARKPEAVRARLEAMIAELVDGRAALDPARLHRRRRTRHEGCDERGRSRRGARHGALEEAKAAFNDDAVYIEKYLQKPRHIEIQVFGDGKGDAVHLGDVTARCSAGTRRYWKNASLRAQCGPAQEIGAIVADAMRKLKYRGAGTVEFLYEDGEFYFIEMNTRLQVEHPVTQMVTGIDLVLEQIRVAAGFRLSFKQEEIELKGHAIECRICAENPKDFRPSPGQITYWHPPGGLGVRVDSGVYQGYRIPPYYDSLIGKLIVFGRTRNDCLMRLRRALSPSSSSTALKRRSRCFRIS